MIVKVHKSGDRTVLCVCDSNLIGKKIEEGKKLLDLSSDYFKGEEKNKGEVLELIKDANILNLSGEESVGLAKELGLISEDEIIMFSNVPHVEIILIKE